MTWLYIPPQALTPAAGGICSAYRSAPAPAGLDLGLALAEPGYRAVGYVERDAFAAAVLVSRMEDQTLDQAPVWADLAGFDGRPWRGAVDLVSAGYPCQPFSVAGRRKGTDDPRHLWPHVARVISECGPVWVFLENVPNHLNLGYREVRGELEGLGYGVTEGLFTAAEVGAPRRRQRLFVLARRLSDAECHALRLEPERGEGSARPAEPWHAQPGDLGEDVADAAGVLGEAIERRQPDRDDAGVADADRRQPPGWRADPGETAGREPHSQPRRPSAGLADAEGERRQQTERGQAAGCRPRPSGAAVADTERSERRPGQPAGHVRDRTRAGRKQETDRSRRGRASQRATLDDADGTGSQGRSDDACQHAGERPAWPPGPEDRDGWERFLRCAPDLEPAVRRDSDGLAYRVDRLRLCGNGVVPLAAAHAWRTLKARFDDGG